MIIKALVLIAAIAIFITPLLFSHTKTQEKYKRLTKRKVNYVKHHWFSCNIARYYPDFETKEFPDHYEIVADRNLQREIIGYKFQQRLPAKLDAHEIR